MLSRDELQRAYPHFDFAMYCENGCGAVIDLLYGYESYKRTSDHIGENRTLTICECCAAEEGHRNEGNETPDTTPVCHKKPKKSIK